MSQIRTKLTKALRAATRSHESAGLFENRFRLARRGRWCDIHGRSPFGGLRLGFCILAGEEPSRYVVDTTNKDKPLWLICQEGISPLGLFL